MEYSYQYNALKNQYIELTKQIGGKREEKTYIDIVTSDKTIRLSIDDVDQISKLLNEYFNGLDELLCLDFHGVTDLFDSDELIPSSLPKCVISYIGGNPTTLSNTINTIRPRIISNEIILGIIVYRKNDIPTCGTKGWIISKILDINKKIQIHFIDDSRKNIQCIENIQSGNVRTYYINKKKNPKRYLTKILSSI